MKNVIVQKKTKQIFIIDDDKYITDAMQKLLEGDLYHVEAFDTGGKGVEKALENPPDIILLDYYLPNEDAREVVTQLHAAENTRNIPLVLISASHTAATVASEWGMTAFLQKPFQINTLLQLVQKYTI